MLRGPQTLGELKQRGERMHQFASLAEVAQTLDELAQRELVVRLDRRAGQKEERYAQLLGGEAPDAAPAEAASDEQPDRLTAIEERLARLERGFEELQVRLDR